jgi:hypothetical protein
MLALLGAVPGRADVTEVVDQQAEVDYATFAAATAAQAATADADCRAQAPREPIVTGKRR